VAITGGFWVATGDQWIAAFFEHDAERYGVKVIYKSIPDADPIVSMVLKAIMRAFDVYHSLISKQKGLNGMAENVKQGFRAGGRAPRGYRLVEVTTGAVREGLPVTKTKLEPDEDAPKVAEYLRLRAEGLGRGTLVRRLGLPWPETSLNGMEWNALTYAGHTVWNVHNEIGTDGYKGGTKRRPRSEWVIHHNTHTALISDAIAEALLAKLENADRHTPRQRTTSHLLSGLLKAPDGTPWRANRTAKSEFYRLSIAGRSRNMPAKRVETAVVETVSRDLLSPTFVRAALKSTRERLVATHAAEIRKTQAEIAALEAKASKYLDMAANLENPAPVYRKIDEVERERGALLRRIVEWEKEDEAAQALANVTEAQVRTMLSHLAEEMRLYPAGDLKDFLTTILDRVELDPEEASLRLCYRIPPRSGNKVASPGGFEPSRGHNGISGLQ
jgi:site-specific DNA recombinase